MGSDSTSSEPMYSQLRGAGLGGTVPDYGRGNIDLNARPIMWNDDGSWSTVDSTIWGVDDKQVLLPTVINDNGTWRHVDSDEALEHFRRTGEHLGYFDTVDEAGAYADRLHRDQERMYEDKARTSGGKDIYPVDTRKSEDTGMAKNAEMNLKNVSKEPMLNQLKKGALAGAKVGAMAGSVKAAKESAVKGAVAGAKAGAMKGALAGAKAAAAKPNK